jgi:CAI-1 autoinducer synthase
LISNLREIGFNIRSETQIIGLETGDDANTLLIRNFLEENGVFGSVFCPPATPKGRNIMRFSLNAEHTSEELDRVIQVCQKAWDHPDLQFF